MEMFGGMVASLDVFELQVKQTEARTSTTKLF